MKKLLIALALASVTTTASANFDFFGGDNNGEWKMGPNGAYWDEGSSWPEWTPMYWMEEFMDNMDDDNNFSGMMPFGNNNTYNTAIPYGYGGFPQQPMMPYAPQTMMPPVPVPVMPVAPVAVPVMPQPAPVAPAVAPVAK